MKIIEHVIEYSSRSDEFDIHAVTDIHHGAKASDTPRLRRRLKAIDENPMALWVDLGDNCDYINMRDPRFDFGTLPKWLVMQHYDNPDMGLAQLQRNDLARIINTYPTLGKKLIGFVKGNHETSIAKWSETDVYLTLLEQIRGDHDHGLAVGLSGYVVLRFRRVTGSKKTNGTTFTVKLYLHHGWGGGGKAGGINIKLEDQMDRYESDVTLMGHHHKVTTHTNSAPLRVNAALQLEQPPDKVGAICGTYLRAVINDADTYAEGKAYRPSPMSDIIVTIRPDKKEIDMVQRSVRETADLAA